MSSLAGREPEKHRRISHSPSDNVDGGVRAGLVNLLV